MLQGRRTPSSGIYIYTRNCFCVFLSCCSLPLPVCCSLPLPVWAALRTALEGQTIDDMFGRRRAGTDSGFDAVISSTHAAAPALEGASMVSSGHALSPAWQPHHHTPAAGHHAVHMPGPVLPSGTAAGMQPMTVYNNPLSEDTHDQVAVAADGGTEAGPPHALAPEALPPPQPQARAADANLAPPDKSAFLRVRKEDMAAAEITFEQEAGGNSEDDDRIAAIRGVYSDQAYPQV